MGRASFQTDRNTCRVNTVPLREMGVFFGQNVVVEEHYCSFEMMEVKVIAMLNVVVVGNSVHFPALLAFLTSSVLGKKEGNLDFQAWIHMVFPLVTSLGAWMEQENPWLGIGFVGAILHVCFGTKPVDLR